MIRFAMAVLVVPVVLIGGIASGGKKEAPVVPPLKGETKTIHLFNGKNLDGWVGFNDYWSVQDGVIVGKNTEPIKHSTYLLTKD
jgi:hypothetical protein